MEVGSRVKITALQKTFNTACAAMPFVGLTGIVVQDSFTPADKIAVEFEGAKLGYLDGEPVTYYIETDTIEPWTLADEYIRCSMLTYPSIFPSRIKVLTHTFLVLGNGIEWNEDGTFTPHDARDGMRYDDIDERADRWHEGVAADIAAGREVRPYKLEMYNETKASAAQDRAEREKAAANIYELAGKPVSDTFRFNFVAEGTTPLDTMREFDKETYGGHYERPDKVMSYIESGYLNVGRVPRRVEQSFFNAMLEVLDAVIRSADNASERDALLVHRAKLVAGVDLHDAGAPAKEVKRPDPVKTTPTADQLKFREVPGFRVAVFLNDVMVYSNSEYSGAAKWAQQTYSLTDEELMTLYRDYKDDYDSED